MKLFWLPSSKKQIAFLTLFGPLMNTVAVFNRTSTLVVAAADIPVVAAGVGVGVEGGEGHIAVW